MDETWPEKGRSADDELTCVFYLLQQGMLRTIALTSEFERLSGYRMVDKICALEARKCVSANLLESILQEILFRKRVLLQF